MGDEDGERFWSGSRKIPKVLSFSNQDNLDNQQYLVNQNSVDFVRYAARLRMETVLVEPVNPGDSIVTKEEAEAALRSHQKPTKIISNPQKKANNSALIQKLLEPLSSFSSLESIQNVAEFEKDDESNGHVAFITAASNLRAICYGIPPVDAMETRRVAGRIIPAMITTTAFVSGLSCIELVKLTQKADLKYHRNAFINLALPFFAFTSPLPAEEINGLHGSKYTIWDRILVKE